MDGRFNYFQRCIYHATKNENEILNFTKQILDTLKELNRNDLHHFSIKPQNIFVEEENVKIYDFGLKINDNKIALSTYYFMNTNAINNLIYNDQKPEFLHMDIYSLFLVIFKSILNIHDKQNYNQNDISTFNYIFSSVES